MHGKRHSSYAFSLGNIGQVLAQLGRLEEALEYHMRSPVIIEEALGARHSSYAVSLGNIGQVLAQLGRLEEAL